MAISQLKGKQLVRASKSDITGTSFIFFPGNRRARRRKKRMSQNLCLLCEFWNVTIAHSGAIGWGFGGLATAFFMGFHCCFGWEHGKEARKER